ncbi:nuclear transport factor 2 family protein [Nonomuraea dietziae]|uniref:nuclear transport factor 2 family protein n=1 Tax=Nonomuraea dietziae TaxID=65515 RepID=UPI003426B437
MDRFDVIDTCTRMAWHADEWEWDRLAQVFAKKVTLDYTSLNGGEPVTLTPAQIIEGWAAAPGSYATTQHLLGNHLVTMDADDAVCPALRATHRKADASLRTLGGNHRFDLVRAGDGWRITTDVMTTAWSDGTR